jgi:predicted DNA-binding transcriptional regulator AlpA
METAKKSKIYTATQFAKKFGLSRATVWRWLTDKDQEKRLKMYDAQKVKIAGKTFIQI